MEGQFLKAFSVSFGGDVPHLAGLKARILWRAAHPLGFGFTRVRFLTLFSPCAKRMLRTRERFLKKRSRCPNSSGRFERNEHEDA